MAMARIAPLLQAWSTTPGQSDKQPFVIPVAMGLLDRDGTLLRTVDLSRQLVNNAEVSGLAFDADGQLLVASTQGVIYKVDPNRDWAATQTADTTWPPGATGLRSLS